MTVLIFPVQSDSSNVLVVVPSVKVKELHKREPDEDPEILFELIIIKI